MKNNTSGFTLIELLVVVLIIGILSSIALPQYQMAVEKSRFTEAMAYLDTYTKGEQLYHMANGSFGNTDKLDISLPTLKHFDIGVCYGSGQEGFCILYINSNRWAHKPNIYLHIKFEDDKYKIYRYCARNEKYCKAISNGATCSHEGGDGDVPWCYSGS